jgi:hypothetical protein
VSRPRTEAGRQSSEELLAAANDVVDRVGVLWRLFRSYRRVPVRLELGFPGLRRNPETMAFEQPDNAAVTATLQFVDERGRTDAAAPGAITWSVSDPSLVTLEPSADGLTAQLGVPAQPSGSYTVAASSGNLSGTEQVSITPGAATGAQLDLQLTPKASAEEARQVHQGHHVVEPRGGSNWG